MVTRETAPIDTMVVIVPDPRNTDVADNYHRSYIGKVGTVFAWSSSDCIKVSFGEEELETKWFLNDEADLYNPSVTGDALDRLRGW